MSKGRLVSCVLCRSAEETPTTGALSIKDEVAAHQNCLLFSSGIFCQNSPEFDDLFGFSAEDVRKEVKRGRKLYCNKCKKTGATAGCEVKRCKRSYHYPCAVAEGAKVLEDQAEGHYGLYCLRHQHPQNAQSKGLVSRSNSDSPGPGPSNHPGGSRSTEVHSPTSEGEEGNRDRDGWIDTNAKCCFHKRSARQLDYFSHSDSSCSPTHSPVKRRLSRDTPEESRSKRKAKDVTHRTQDSSNSDLAMFAPLESDIDERTDSVPEQQFDRKDGPSQSPWVKPSQHIQNLLSTVQLKLDAEDVCELTKGKHRRGENSRRNSDEDESTTNSEDSQSLLFPLRISRPEIQRMDDPKVVHAEEEEEEERNRDGGSSPDHHAAGPSSPQQSSTAPPPSADNCKPNGLPPVHLPSSPACPVEPPFDPDPSIDSQSFWKSCNAAGCTQAIFNDFIHELNDVARRIQSDRASQDDYSNALKVMAASGKLGEIVAKQQKELQQKQEELQKAAAAMKQVVSALKR